jgi:integrase
VERKGKDQSTKSKGGKVSTFKRGGTWWYKFVFGGQLIRQSSKSKSRTVCIKAERARREQLERGYNGIATRQRPQLFAVAAAAWHSAKSAQWSPRTALIEELNLKHLNPCFGGMLLCDISADSIGGYQAKRTQEGAAPKTVNLEVGTLRSILRRYRLWGNIQPDVRLLRVREDVGIALTQDEESVLLKECRESRSRSLYVAVLMAIDTCMRYSEIRLLRWSQIDFRNANVRVGDSKTEDGDSRIIPTSKRLGTILEFWAALFPECKPNHFVFPFEKCGGRGKDKVFGFRGGVAYGTDPTRATGNWKEAWEAAKARAGAALNPDDKKPEPLRCRFHDLRHTGCTRMLEAGTAFSVVAVIMGWSPSTAVRMARRYGHIGHAARREAIDKASHATVFDSEGAQGWAQKWAQSSVHRLEEVN